MSVSVIFTVSVSVVDNNKYLYPDESSATLETVNSLPSNFVSPKEVLLVPEVSVNLPARVTFDGQVVESSLSNAEASLPCK